MNGFICYGRILICRFPKCGWNYLDYQYHRCCQAVSPSQMQKASSIHSHMHLLLVLTHFCPSDAVTLIVLAIRTLWWMAELHFSWLIWVTAAALSVTQPALKESSCWGRREAEGGSSVRSVLMSLRIWMPYSFFARITLFNFIFTLGTDGTFLWCLLFCNVCSSVYKFRCLHTNPTYMLHVCWHLPA